jgi:hypothetical protein
MFIIDTNSFRVLGNYYPDVFPTFWQQLNEAVSDGRVGSVREVRKEIELQNASEHLAEWVTRNPLVFPTPTDSEMEMVAEIFRVRHFQQLIGEKQRLRGQPVADPFLVARAHVLGGCVVTEEVLKPQAAKIPNVCDHFGVKCTDMRGLLKEFGWRF